MFCSSLLLWGSFVRRQSFDLVTKLLMLDTGEKSLEVEVRLLIYLGILKQMHTQYPYFNKVDHERVFSPRNDNSKTTLSDDT